MHSRTKIIIDTDISLGTPGAEIDDGAALLMLLNSPEVEVMGITTVHGNVPVGLATTNALRLVSLAGFSMVPIFEGSGAPFKIDDEWLGFLSAWQSKYGPTPPWDSHPGSLTGVDAIISAIEDNPGEVSIVALGPLTNLALAMRSAPHIIKMVKSVVAMGGSLTISPQAEFNIRCDPEAAAVVFAAGCPLWLHGIEITRQSLFTPQNFEALDGSNPALSLLKKQAAQWIPVVETQGWETGGCSLHDAVAAAALLEPDIFRYQSRHSIQVNLDFGPERGVTRVTPQDNSVNLSIATGIDAPSCKGFIQSRLHSLAEIAQTNKSNF